MDVLVLKLNFEDFRFCSVTLNRYLVIGNFRYKIIVWVRLHCKPSDLKCEMTVMPLE